MRQKCPVFQALWSIARRAFEVFQQQLAPGKMLPGRQHRFVGRRNLSLELDEPNDRSKPHLWANWIVEGEEEVPYVKILHPI
jgi:hypothetical protein